MKKYIPTYLVFIAAIVLSSCDKDFNSGDFDRRGISNRTETNTRNESVETRHIFIIYSAGYNTISNYLTEDIRDVLNGFLPLNIQSRADDVLLIYSQHWKDGTSKPENVESALFRASKDQNGSVQLDTLKVYGADVISASATTLNNVLSYVQKRYPAKSYGLLVSSHGSGWVPPGYFNNTEVVWTSAEPSISPSSITQAEVGSSSYEIDLKDFAKAIPMKLDYLLLDACLMGGIETAYELKSKCKVIGFSQTEIMADGFNYSTLVEKLLGAETPDLLAVCKDTFAIYDSPTAPNPYCTISAVDCDKLEPLADTCRYLFEKYRSNLAAINSNEVQKYWRKEKHWFYDLRDILVKAGVNEDDLAELDNALSGCILYKAATKSYFDGSTDGVPINTHCGLSMYLPANGSSYLNTYYSDFKWNKATLLVK